MVLVDFRILVVFCFTPTTLWFLERRRWILGPIAVYKTALLAPLAAMTHPFPIPIQFLKIHVSQWQNRIVPIYYRPLAVVSIVSIERHR